MQAQASVVRCTERSVGRGRHLRGERAATARSSGAADDTAGPSHDLRHDVQAQAVATDAAGHVRISSVELLEGALALLIGHPDATVADGELELAAREFDIHADAPAVRRVLD